MKSFVSVAYGLIAYTLSIATILYAIGFVGDLVMPKSIDTGSPAPWAEALIVDMLLLGLFAAQHSVMARPPFKRWWTKIVPPSVERSTFVLFASVALQLLYWQWRPITSVIWTVTNPAGVLVLEGLFWVGWALLLISTFLIHHFELFGLRQVFARMKGQTLPAPAFKSPLFYRYVRHPIYLGFLLAFWSTPRMTGGHLLFALATTGYILLGIQLEEHDLIDLFGERYRRYRKQVGMLFPFPRARSTERLDETAPTTAPQRQG